MELKDLMNSFNAEEMKAEVTNGNMELRAMLTDLINSKCFCHFVSLNTIFIS